MGRLDEIRERVRSRHPTLGRRIPTVQPPHETTAIVLGRTQGGDLERIGDRARVEHAHVIGTTGGGKSKFLELCIRQDIRNGRGVCVVDPHGDHPDSLYRSLVGWLDRSGYASERTIHLLDPNSATHTTGFNPLARPDVETDLSVIAGVTLEAFARAWGDEDTTGKPTIERVLTATFTALAELGLTLVEAPLLLDRQDRHGLRAYALATVTDRYARDELQRLHELSLDYVRRHDFDLEVVGPINRIARFVRPPAIRTMVGQTERVIDFRRAMDDGEIILCNLSGGQQVYERDADLLGRMLTRFLLFQCKRRRNPERPFFVYLDECHRFLSGDLENILAEARKYGTGLVLSHQWLAQLAADDDTMLSAVRNATNVKAVFRLKDPEEAEDLAHMVVPLNLEVPVHVLVKPSVVGQQRVLMKSAGVAEQHSATSSSGQSESESESETASYVESVARTKATGSAVGSSSGTSTSDMQSRASMTGAGQGTSSGEMMLPAPGLFGTPPIVGLSEGVSTMSHHAESAGSGMARTQMDATSNVENSMYAETHGSAEGYARSRARGRSVMTGEAQSTGSSRSEGTQEAFEPLFADLPSAVHGKENVLYLAAQTLRGLTTGKAFVNFVDARGMHAGLLTVPNVENFAPDVQDFPVVRARILTNSSIAIPLAEAKALVDARERALIVKGNEARTPPEPATAAGYRTKKVRAPKNETDVSGDADETTESSQAPSPVKGRTREARRPPAPLDRKAPTGKSATKRSTPKKP